MSVDVGATLRAVDRRVVGLNTDTLADHARRRAAGQGYDAALRELGVGSLRYPGGEIADGYLWSVPPYLSPRPTLARTGPGEWPAGDPRWVADDGAFVDRPLDFDEFMAQARALGAEPVLVVAFDAMYTPATAGGVAPSRQDLLDAAVAWVRYANVVRGYRVRYWEIGNESYLDTYNGGARADDYARDLVDFARAMKAVDPTILIGANGPDSRDGRGDRDQSGRWWQTVLQLAAPAIDFLAVHAYPAWWHGYEAYRTSTPPLTSAVDGAVAALRAWAPAEARRIRVAVTELNLIDWGAQAGATDRNTLGQAVALCELIGAHLVHPRVDLAQVWATRWIDPLAPAAWSTLDPENALLPTGRALAIWGHFLLPTMVRTTGTPLVRIFASHDPATGRLHLVIINKDTTVQAATVALRGYAARYRGARWQLAGSGPEDTAPRWERAAPLAETGGGLTLALPPVSVTVIALEPPPAE